MLVSEKKNVIQWGGGLNQGLLGWGVGEKSKNY